MTLLAIRDATTHQGLQGDASGVPHPRDALAHGQGSVGWGSLVRGHHRSAALLQNLIHNLLLEIGTHAQVDTGLAKGSGIGRN